MARKVEWTNRALKDRFQILSYWINRNKSNSYSIKLDDLFIESLKLLSLFPFAGKPTRVANVRMKIIKKYVLVYQVTDNEIIVLRLWDSRQNPQNLKY
jgi:addiction module RelE/StbE family toxin